MPISEVEENADDEMDKPQKEEPKIEENAKESPSREEKSHKVEHPKVSNEKFIEVMKIYFSFFGAHFSRIELEKKSSTEENPDKNQKRQKMEEKFIKEEPME